MEQLRKDFGNILIANEVKRSDMIDGKEDIAVEGYTAKGLFIEKDFTLVDSYVEYLTALNIKTQPVDFVNNLKDAANVIIK